MVHRGRASTGPPGPPAEERGAYGRVIAGRREITAAAADAGEATRNSRRIQPSTRREYILARQAGEPAAPDVGALRELSHFAAAYVCLDGTARAGVVFGHSRSCRGLGVDGRIVQRRLDVGGD